MKRTLPQNKNDWVHSVIFEPQHKYLVLLWNNKTDTYCVTGLLDAYSDCTSNRPILAYEPIQSA